MGERLKPSSGMNTAPAPVRVATGAETLTALNNYIAGNPGSETTMTGIGFDPHNGGQFRIGTQNEQGLIDHAKPSNPVSLVQVDTTKMTRQAVAQDVPAALAQDAKLGAVNTLTNFGAQFAPFVAAGVDAFGVTEGSFIPTSVAGRAVTKLVSETTSAYKRSQLLNQQAPDTTAQHREIVQRLGQKIQLNGDQVVLVNQGETIATPKSEAAQAYEQGVRQAIVDYWQSLDAKPEGEAVTPEALRGQLGETLAALTKQFNSVEYAKEAYRGDFYANNYLEIADAGQRALAEGYSQLNLQEGLFKSNLIIAEAASPLPMERMNMVEKAAEKLHRVTHSMMSIDKLQTGLTMAKGLAESVGRTLAVRGAGLASPLVAGAFASVEAARQESKQRDLAMRRRAYGQERRIDEATVVAAEQDRSKANRARAKALRAAYERQQSLLETKDAKTVSQQFGEQLAEMANFYRDKRELTPEMSEGYLREMANFDDRWSFQGETGTILFSVSGPEKAEQEVWEMRGRRAMMQETLVKVRALQAVGEDRTKLEATTEQMRQTVQNELEAIKARQDGTSELELLTAQKRSLDQRFKFNQLKRAAKTGVTSAAMMGLYSVVGKATRLILGPGTWGSVVGGLARVGIMLPGSVKRLKSARGSRATPSVERAAKQEAVNGRQAERAATHEIRDLEKAQRALEREQQHAVRAATRVAATEQRNAARPAAETEAPEQAEVIDFPATVSTRRYLGLPTTDGHASFEHLLNVLNGNRAA